MMTRYAVLDAANKVVNIILWDGQSPYESAETVVEVGANETCEIGFERVGEAWVAPVVEPEPEPEPDPAAALRQAGIDKLMALGLTEDEAKAIAGI